MDPFKAFEKLGWEHSSSAYSKSFPAITNQSIPFVRDALQIDASSRVLDIACGPGFFTSAVAEITPEVTGVDFSPEMLAEARTLHPELTFVEGDAESLAFEDETFDAVAVNFGILHLGFPKKAFLEAYRVLKPGGRFAFSVWASPEEARGFKVILEAVKAHGSFDVPLPEGPNFFHYSDPANAEEDLKEAGFSEISSLVMPLEWRVESAADCFEAIFQGTARTGALLRGQSEQCFRAIKEAVLSGFQSQFAAPDGGLRVPMPAMLYAATKVGRDS